MHQMTIDLERGLLDQFPDFMDCVRASVYDCGIKFGAIAAELDYSPSELSRRLSKVGDLPAVMGDLPKIMKVTKDLRPIYWLVESFVVEDTTKERPALAPITKLIPQLEAALKCVRKR